ncbi:PC4-domain-containing protein [Cylindrobasidium torrendii FP15055 ss-10]|uniref:PC4-domain-containing protein n=1 Tax=Cylindrobasidium torrendii FP15055 ss-10 TaxID=1314674 RepID=A0A0D7BS06_9AGAR|nr:PC4-domain-containing protein [Cylindrobasidium torrendii FP15055 ss-10]
MGKRKNDATSSEEASDSEVEERKSIKKARKSDPPKGKAKIMAKKPKYDSDSDPDERIATKSKRPPKKETKPAGSKKAPTKAAATSTSSEEWVDLGKKKRVAINNWNGRLFVDIREFYVDAEGDNKPGKKGISLSPEQWTALKDNMAHIDELLESSA